MCHCEGQAMEWKGQTKGWMGGSTTFAHRVPVCPCPATALWVAEPSLGHRGCEIAAEYSWCFQSFSFFQVETFKISVFNSDGKI